MHLIKYPVETKYDSDVITGACSGVLVVTPTICIGDALDRLLGRLQSLKCDTLVLTSATSPDQWSRSSEGRLTEIIAIDDATRLEWRDAWPSLSLAAANSRASWDLPIKRNIGCRLAQERGYHTVFFLDDDIGGLTQRDIVLGQEFARLYGVFGIRCGYFPDDSVLAHIERFLGRHTGDFLSGNCLFVDLRTQLGFFPGIYNEDWFFTMSCDALALGSYSNHFVSQSEHTKWLSAEEAQWQEFGEFMAVVVLAEVTNGTGQNCLNARFWNCKRHQRLSEIKRLECDLLQSSMVSELLPPVKRARGVVEKIHPDDCVRFMDLFLEDVEIARRG